MAALLAALLLLGILVIWIPGRQTVGLLQSGIYLLALVLAARRVREPHRLKGSLLLIPLAGTVLWGLIQLWSGWSVYRFETWNAVLTWGACLAVFWLSFELFERRERRSWFRNTLIGFGLALSVLSVVQYFTAPGRVFWLFEVEYANVGPFLNRDHYSTFVELVLPLALFDALRDKRKVLSHSLIVGAMFASVIATASRAGSILVTLEILAVVFLVLSPRLRTAGTLGRTLSWTVLSALAFSTIVGWETLWSRFQDPDPFRGRREMLVSSLKMVSDRPWTGFGLGTWPAAYPAYAVTDFGLGLFVNHAHNDWVEWAAEGGLPLALLLLLVALWSARLAVRFPWGVGVVAAFCHAAIDFPMQRPALAALVFALLGAMAAAGRPHPVSRGTSGTQHESDEGG